MKGALLVILLISSSLAWNIAHTYSQNTTGGNVVAVAYSGDSSTVVEGNENGVLRSFSLSTGELTHELSLNASGIKSIKTNPAGNTYAVCATDKIFLVNSSSLTILNETTFPNGECSDIEWYPNGTSFAAVGKQGNLSQYVIFNSNLTVAQRVNVELEEGSEIYESSISPNGKYIVIAGSESSNTTASNVLVYELATGLLVGDIDIATSLIDTRKRIEFNPSGNELVVLYEGTNTIEVHKLNTNGQFVKEKDLIFGSNVVDMQYMNDGSLAVLRQNGTSSLVDFVSVSDSNGNNIASNDQIVADKGNPTFLKISPDNKYIGVAFLGNGLNIYSKNENKEAYIPVIAAVVGAVVAGSIGAVVASTAPGVIGAVGSAGGSAPAGIIGISEVQNVAGQAGNGLKAIEESGKGIL